MYWQDKFTLQSSGRGTYEITSKIEEMIRASGVQQGLCHLFIQHTSASLIISENADPAVRVDLETFMSKLSPDGDPMFIHQDGTYINHYCIPNPEKMLLSVIKKTMSCLR